MGVSPSKESYVVKKDYTDPFEGKHYSKGDVISNRQGRNVQVQEQGNYRNVSQYNRIWGPNVRLKDEDIQTRNAWLRRGAKASGRSANTLRTDPKVRKAYTQFYRIDKEDRKNTKPSGSLAKLLVALGLRDEDDTHDVGDTPKGKGNQ